ncbi:DMT family transporter [uncultured Tateyamaria sp.]|uniref:DMT family transporter n=1 Tax=uncultured Tateyamaria sp. TaxID=455651 RepID=UPI002613B724|nr:DMT family transporter [uncultured Tateyamaria sp.]
MTQTRQNIAGLGILFVLIGVFCISINDLLIKQLSGGYPLHQIVFARSALGILVTLIIVQFEGGWGILRTRHPWAHALRGLLIVIANMTFFLALAVLPLADATALFFAAPLFITLLSIPILGEKVGPLRLTAVAVGFAGVIIMQRPWADASTLEVSRLVLMLPVLSALTYALNQLMTRKLGVESKASAMAVYIQGTFIIVSLLFFAVAGDGRFADGATNGSVVFLLRAWVWPADSDLWVFIGLGVNSAVIGYCLSQAYRLADAATIAPFEYIGLPLAVVWGFVVFGDLPVIEVWIGIALILGAGLFVFLRERQKARTAHRRPIRGRNG